MGSTQKPTPRTAKTLLYAGPRAEGPAPTSCRTVHSTCVEKNRSSALGGGGWKWRVEADGRPWEAPGDSPPAPDAARRAYGSPGSHPAHPPPQTAAQARTRRPIWPLRPPRGRPWPAPFTHLPVPCDQTTRPRRVWAATKARGVLPGRWGELGVVGLAHGTPIGGVLVQPTISDFSLMPAVYWPCGHSNAGT